MKLLKMFRFVKEEEVYTIERILKEIGNPNFLTDLPTSSMSSYSIEMIEKYKKALLKMIDNQGRIEACLKKGEPTIENLSVELDPNADELVTSEGAFEDLLRTKNFEEIKKSYAGKIAKWYKKYLRIMKI
jgi:hypothetical protein